MAINVKNGTPIHGPSLCETCTNAHIAKGYRASEKLVVCTAHEPARQVRFSVCRCTDYRDRARQSLWEMERIAWLLSPRGPKLRAGFTPPSEQRKDEDEMELILDHEK
jgi:hypothetical protein